MVAYEKTFSCFRELFSSVFCECVLLYFPSSTSYRFGSTHIPFSMLSYIWKHPFLALENFSSVFCECVPQQYIIPIPQYAYPAQHAWLHMKKPLLASENCCVVFSANVYACTFPAVHRINLAVRLSSSACFASLYMPARFFYFKKLLYSVFCECVPLYLPSSTSYRFGSTPIKLSMLRYIWQHAFLTLKNCVKLFSVNVYPCISSAVRRTDSAVRLSRSACFLTYDSILFLVLTCFGLEI